NTMKAMSAVPTMSTPPATGAIRGPSVFNTRENGGPPGSTTTRPTGMPATRMGANSRPRRARNAPPSGPLSPGSGPGPGLGPGPGPGLGPGPGAGLGPGPGPGPDPGPLGPHRRANRRAPSDSRYS